MWNDRDRLAKSVVAGLADRDRNLATDLILNSGTGAHGIGMLLRLVKPLVLSPFVSHSLRRYLSMPNHADLAVIKQLIETGHIVQVPGPRDRRQRELYPTPKGRDLAMALAVPQSRRIHEALQEAGEGARMSATAFLKAMVDPALREQVDRLPAAANGEEMNV